MPATAMRTVQIPSGEDIPALGQGTWGMGDDPASRATEVASLRLGFDLGLALVDTAEMYADGIAEEIVGEAMAGYRDEVFVVTKVLPSNATRRGTIAACERSLARLGTDRIDLYLLHWKGSVPLAETVEAFETLRDRGLIRHWGVSNLDVADLEELVAVTGGATVQTDQVLYNLTRRGIEHDLLPWCRQRGVPIMAYSPIEQARLLHHRALRQVAERRGVTPAQVALAWTLRADGVLAIPKAATPSHVRENLAALELRLDDADLRALDRAFPPPSGPTPLETL